MFPCMAAILFGKKKQAEHTLSIHLFLKRLTLYCTLILIQWHFNRIKVALYPYYTTGKFR